jgi:hypothetical protein
MMTEEKKGTQGKGKEKQSEKRLCGIGDSRQRSLQESSKTVIDETQRGEIKKH